MKLKSSIPEYTKREFRLIIQKIMDCEGTEESLSELIAHLNGLAAGAGGSDLIYYPKSGADNSAEAIVNIIQEWCLANGDPGFKPRF